MLSDIKTYTKINTDDTSEIKQGADQIFYNLVIHNYISLKQFKNLTNFKAKCPIFYELPKIHKPNIPLRPIVSQINGPTYKLSKYIDSLLTTAERHIPYLLKDTTAFLQLIDKYKNINSNTILVTSDVVSLYTNIPQDEGSNLVSEFYEETLNHFLDTHLILIPPDEVNNIIK